MNNQNEREIIRLTKWMILLLMVLIILTFVQCAKEAKADVITGEIPLAGFSLMQKQTNYTVYPEGIELLAQVMYHENYVNGEEVMYYTGAVVMNRVRSKNFPDTVKKVIYQNNPRQYSTTEEFFTEDIPESVYHLACRVAKGTPDVPFNVVYQAMFKQGSGVWKHESTEYFCYE